MYGLHKLTLYPNAQVMLVEGEKSADAGQEKFIAAGVPIERLIVLGWPGGGKAVRFVDWSPLSGRNVGLWPDADQQNYVEGHPKQGQRVPFLEQPGTVAMLDIFDRIAPDALAVKFIVPPEGVPCGWDIADEFPGGLALMPFLKGASMLAQDVRERFAVAEPEPEPQPPSTPPEPDMPWAGEPEPDYSQEDTSGVDDDEDDGPAPVPSIDDDLDELVRNKHFTILGYDQGDYYLFNHAKKQVMRMRKADMNEIGLIEHAPINWWEFHFWWPQWRHQQTHGGELDLRHRARPWHLRPDPGSRPWCVARQTGKWRRAVRVPPRALFVRGWRGHGYRRVSVVLRVPNGAQDA